MGEARAATLATTSQAPPSLTPPRKGEGNKLRERSFRQTQNGKIRCAATSARCSISSHRRPKTRSALRRCNSCASSRALHPSHTNEDAFNRAVDEVSDAARRLLDSLVDGEPGQEPRSRGDQSARARQGAVCVIGCRMGRAQRNPTMRDGLRFTQPILLSWPSDRSALWLSPDGRNLRR